MIDSNPPESNRFEAGRENLIFKISSASEASLRHPERNEDAIAFDQKAGFAIVLDGMGGLDAGDEASNLACKVITERILKLKETADLAKVQAEMIKALGDASKQVNKKVPRSGTTAVVLKIVGKERKIAVIASVGDSRAYLLREGNLRLITEDDSTIPLVDRQRFDDTNGDDLDKYDYAVFRQKNQITQNIGSGEKLNVHLYSEELKKGDKIILTSDGVHDNLRTSDIRDTAAGENAAERLVNKAFEVSKTDLFRAKPDDMSVIMIEVS
ncbi:MAG TPA: PP2C family serine/threonine-protein phosphatase [Patescibacteria group bacterium]